MYMLGRENQYNGLKCYTVVRKFFDGKYFIDKKIRGKIFSLMHDFLEIFLPWTNIASDNIYARYKAIDRDLGFYARWGAA